MTSTAGSRTNEAVAQFFETVEPVKACCATPTFSYFAIKKNGVFNLIQGMLFLNLPTTDAQLSHFQSENIRAGKYLLSDLGYTPEEFVAAARLGKIETPIGPLIISKKEPNSVYGSFTALHSAGLQHQNRLAVLHLAGDRRLLFINQPMQDWELRAAATPYDSVTELLGEYGLGLITDHDHVAIDIVLAPVCAIDSDSTIIAGKAKITVRVNPHLDIKLVRLGYRVRSQDKTHSRSSIVGEDMQWATTAEAKIGTCEFEVPIGAIVQNLLSYNNVTQQNYWVVDPNSWQNIHRAAYEAFDPNLKALGEVILGDTNRGGARHFENGIASLLWMLGFNVLFFGTRITEAADIVASTPKGNLL